MKWLSWYHRFLVCLIKYPCAFIFISLYWIDYFISDNGSKRNSILVRLKEQHIEGFIKNLLHEYCSTWPLDSEQSSLWSSRVEQFESGFGNRILLELIFSFFLWFLVICAVYLSSFLCVNFIISICREFN